MGFPIVVHYKGVVLVRYRRPIIEVDPRHSQNFADDQCQRYPCSKICA